MLALAEAGQVALCHSYRIGRKRIKRWLFPDGIVAGGQ
jgi:hypothetical protein